MSAALLLGTSCSITDLAVGGLTDALAGGAESYASDNDPELVRSAMPFVLKTVESLLLSSPGNEDLLVQACSGFTQYAYAFVELDAERLENEDYTLSQEWNDRAYNMYLRARDYGLEALEGRHPGIVEQLRLDPENAVTVLEERDVEFIYWTAASWGSAIGVGLDRLETAADVDSVRALLYRAVELDGDWNYGAIHEALISIESLPEAMGGSPERARKHFKEAVELADGRSASPYVSLAIGVALPNQDAAEFHSLLNAALAIDVDSAPYKRLANLVTQRRARTLLDRMEDLFLEPFDPDTTNPFSSE